MRFLFPKAIGSSVTPQDDEDVVVSRNIAQCGSALPRVVAPRVVRAPVPAAPPVQAAPSIPKAAATKSWGKKLLWGGLLCLALAGIACVIAASHGAATAPMLKVGVLLVKKASVFFHTHGGATAVTKASTLHKASMGLELSFFTAPAAVSTGVLIRERCFKSNAKARS